MINIDIQYNNCDLKNPYNISEESFSSIKFKICIDKILSRQSKKSLITDLRKEIHKTTSAIEWLIASHVDTEIAYYQSMYDRITTNKSADLDNSLKPLIDSFSGKNGVLIDDSQIRTLNMLWISRDEDIKHDIISIEFTFANDCFYHKKNLFFIQSHNAIYSGFNIDPHNIKTLIDAKRIAHARQKMIKSAEKFDPNLGIGLMPIINIHRSRLNGFDSSTILTTQQLNKLCLDNGLTYKELRKFISSHKIS
jgi:Holliday junction resolvase RusA-like endonuclease